MNGSQVSWPLRFGAYCLQWGFVGVALVCIAIFIVVMIIATICVEIFAAIAVPILGWMLNRQFQQYENRLR